MGSIIKLIASMVSVIISAYILPGVQVAGLLPALMVAVLLGLANAVIKPILVLLTLPITLLTLGLFTFVINALLILLVDALVPGFEVDGFIWALLFSLVLSVVSSVVNSVVD
jgi:putative membrane protein